MLFPDSEVVRIWSVSADAVIDAIRGTLTVSRAWRVD